MQNRISLRGKSLGRTSHFLILGSIVSFFFLVWLLLSYGGFVNPIFIPTPTAVFRAVIALYQDFNLLNDIWWSMIRIFLGFGLAVLLAVPIGFYSAINKFWKSLSEPVLSFVRYIPPSALLPLFLLWFGVGETAKVLLIAFGLFPYIAFMVYDVVVQTKSELIDTAYTLGAKNNDIMKKVIIPASLPGIWDVLRINIGAAWTLLVLAEIIASEVGLGHLIITSQRFVKTPNVFVVIIIIGFLGYITDIFFKVTYKIFFPWTEKSYHAGN